MDSLKIHGTQQTPTIDFKINGDLLIEGISLPENVHSFYGSVFEWIDELKNNLPKHITITLDIEYSNTASSVIILKLLRKLIDYSKEGPSLKIVWKYDKEDEDMRDDGEKFQNLTNFKFEFIER